MWLKTRPLGTNVSKLYKLLRRRICIFLVIFFVNSKLFQQSEKACYAKYLKVEDVIATSAQNKRLAKLKYRSSLLPFSRGNFESGKDMRGLMFYSYGCIFSSLTAF